MADTTTSTVHLHCVRRRHGILRDGQVIEIHCRWCSQTAGKLIYHRWRIDGGDPIDDRVEAF